MYKKYAVEWVKALRSGKYKQGTGYLCQIGSDGNDKYCCLGVLCKVLKVRRTKSKGDTYYNYGHGSVVLPSAVMKKTGIKTSVGQISLEDNPKQSNTLANMNDFKGMSFEEIADAIEKNYKSL